MKYELDELGFPIMGAAVKKVDSTPLSTKEPLRAGKYELDELGFPKLNTGDLPEVQSFADLEKDIPDVIEKKVAGEASSSLWRRTLGDAAVALGKSVGYVPEMGVGLVDAVLKYNPVTGSLLEPGIVGKSISSGQLGPLAVRFNDLQKTLSDLYSPEEQAALMEIQNAKGFTGKVTAAVQNPSALAANLLESSLPMLAGGALGKVAGAAAGVGSTLAGAIGEAAATVGSQVEQVRQQIESGLLTDEQMGLLAGSGLVTGLLSLGGGKLSKYLGLADIDTLLAKGTTDIAEQVLKEAKAKTLLKVIGGAVQEGFLEEFPQSIQEQVAANLAAGKKWDEGMLDSGVMGALVGMFMGGGANVYGRFQNVEDAKKIIKDAAQTQTVADDFHFLPTPVTVPIQEQAGPIKEKETGILTSPVPEVPPPSTLEAGRPSPNKMIPKVQLKEGVELTEDHVAFIGEQNYGMKPVEARVAAKVLTEIARAEGLSVNEFVKREGLALGIVQEKPAEYTYEFKAPEGATGSTKITKQEDGSWKVEQDVLHPNNVLEKTEKILESDDEVVTLARRLNRAGYKNEFFQSVYEITGGEIAGTPYFLTAPRAILSGEMNMPDNKSLPGTQILGRLQNVQGIKKLELDFYKVQGLEEFLKENRTLKEVSDWMMENGPKVEIKELQATEPVGEDAQQFARLQHWVDGLPESDRKLASEFFSATKPEEEKRKVLLQAGWSGEAISDLIKYRELYRQNLNKPSTKNDSATARFQQVNPKELSNMPGAVDLLVRIPSREGGIFSLTELDTNRWIVEHNGEKVSPEFSSKEKADIYLKNSVRPKYKSIHYQKEGKNLLSHVRGYMETLPDGRKVFHVFEVQSDWAQELRESHKKIVKEDAITWNVRNVTDNSLIRSFSTELEAKDYIENTRIESDPLLYIYEPLALKAAISYAKSQGADAIAISDAQTAMLTEEHDTKTHSYWTTDLKQLQQKSNLDPARFKVVGLDDGISLQRNEVAKILDVQSNEIVGAFKKVEFGVRLDPYQRGIGGALQQKVINNIDTTLKTTGIQQERGMRLHYDKILPKIAEKLTGSKGEVVEFGTHKNAVEDQYTTYRNDRFENENAGKPRANLILKNPDGTPQTVIRARMYSLEKAEDKHSLFQKADKSTKGSLYFSPTGEKIISLMKTGDFSTVVHEYGHLILPLLNQEQRGIVAKWAVTVGATEEGILDILEKKSLGKILNKSDEAIYADVHELFAKTFEQYLMTGVAPSTRLKELFRYCKNILTKIYLHAKKVPGSNLTPEISKVFDQFLLGDTELYGFKNEQGQYVTGKIRVVGGKVKNLFRIVIRPNMDYEIVKRNGIPVIITDTLKEIPVMNLIRGESLTLEQRKLLGDMVTWVSPVDSSEELSIDVTAGTVVYSRVHLKAMELPKLEALARRLGIKLGNKKLPTHYPREVIEQLIQDVQIAKMNAVNPDVTYEEVFDNIEVVQLPSETRSSWFDSLYGKWSSWMLDIVRDYAGGGTLQQYHFQKGRKATDDAHTVIGEQNELVLKVQRLVKNIFFGKTRRALAELQDGAFLYDAEGKRVGFISNTAIHLDKSYKAFRTGTLGAEAQEVIVAIRAFLDNQAKIAVRENMSIMVDGKRVPFMLDQDGKAREVMPRSYTEDFWRILSHEDPTMRKQLAKAMSIAGNIEIQEADKIVESLKKKSAKEARLYLESERLVEVMPTHIALPNGKLVEILHTDPFTYVQRLQMKLGLRVGFFRAYASIPKGTVDPATGIVTQVPYKVIDPKNLESMIFDFNRKTNGGGLALSRLFRALNGLPVTDNFTFNVDSPGYSMYRAWHEIMTVKKALWLTKAAIVNVTEPVGAIGMVGGRRWGRAAGAFGKALVPHLMWKTLNNVTFHQVPIFKEKLSADHWTLMKDAATRNGTMAPHLVRWSVDPRFAISSTVKNISDGIVAASGTTGAISFGEYFVSWAGHLMAEEMSRGRISAMDAARLRVLGFTEAEVEVMIAGKTPEAAALYEKIPVRMVTGLLGTNTLPAERSLWRNWKYARDIIAFDSYGATMARLYNLHLRELYLRRTGKPQSKYRGWKKFAQDAWMVSNLPVSPEFRKTFAAKLGAGILASGLRQLLTYGPASLLFIDWDDEEEGWLPQYLKLGADMFIQSSMSGPLANFYYDYKQGQLNPIDTLEKAVLPLTVFDDMFHLAWNLSKAPVLEKPHILREYIRSSTSASSAVATWVAIAHHGFSAEDPKLRIAKKKFWEFYKEEKPSQASFSGKLYSDSYDVYMKHAFDVINETERVFTSSGDLKATEKNKNVDTNVKRLLMKALQTDAVMKGGGNKKVAEAIAGKKLLTKLNKEAEARFKKKVGPELYEQLQEHDWVLNWWSKRVKGE